MLVVMALCVFLFPLFVSGFYFTASRRLVVVDSGIVADYFVFLLFTETQATIFSRPITQLRKHHCAHPYHKKSILIVLHIASDMIPHDIVHDPIQIFHLGQHYKRLSSL